LSWKLQQLSADAIRGISVTASGASTSYNWHNVPSVERFNWAAFGTTGVFMHKCYCNNTKKIDVQNNV
jgi:hypothetical protein